MASKLELLIQQEVAKTDSRINDARDYFDTYRINFFKNNEAFAKELRLCYSQSFRLNPELPRNKILLYALKIQCRLVKVASSVLKDAVEDLSMKSFSGGSLEWLELKERNSKRVLHKAGILLDEFETVLKKEQSLPASVFVFRLQELRRELLFLEPEISDVIVEVFKGTMVLSGVAPSSDEFEGSLDMED